MCRADLKLKNFHFSGTAAAVAVGPGGALFFHNGRSDVVIYTSRTLSKVSVFFKMDLHEKVKLHEIIHQTSSNAGWKSLSAHWSSLSCLSSLFSLQPRQEEGERERERLKAEK